MTTPGDWSGAPREPWRSTARPESNEIVISEEDLAPEGARHYGTDGIERERDTTTWKLVAAIWGVALAVLIGGLVVGAGHGAPPTSPTTTTSPYSSLLGGL